MTELIETAADLEPSTRKAFRRLILSIADSKRLLGIRYSDWLLGAPSIEAGIAASSLAQDEWGHARLVYSILKEFDEDPLELEHQRSSHEYCSADPLDHPFPDWAAVTAGIVVVDGALTVLLRGLGEGAHQALSGRVAKMLAEEEYHRDLGSAWFRRLADSRGEGRERLTAEVAGMLPPTLDAFFPLDTAQERLVEAGVLPASTLLRERFRDETAELLSLVGAEVPVDTEPPGDWDPVRGRGPGHPDEEAVERARGDRNRALFVE